MHIVIATTGALSPAPVAEFTQRLLGDGGKVSVITVIEVPRTFLDTIRSEEWDPLHDTEPEWRSREDAIIARYVEERGRKLTDPIQAALRGVSIEAEVRYLEGEDPAATIIEAVREWEGDLVILGATRRIFDETAWESVSARVMAESHKPVLVVPPRDRSSSPPSDDDYVRFDTTADETPDD